MQGESLSPKRTRGLQFSLLVIPSCWHNVNTCPANEAMKTVIENMYSALTTACTSIHDQLSVAWSASTTYPSRSHDTCLVFQ
ncbi:hypothetical protein DEU56DRAFT_471153 [Suillus clintonianus]|uniref:uncharacterized protein n=1 Tax=Suillus clintonianus TaxID=1904413 RepID=UPI001B876A35|nr:uncharacterized protein DEU56DRAFT_471153 [Suillus clintonianus]KAG2153173.1 hypothetical protein DEU56DRAFT_471153 [Suillus clintonianus]